MCDWPHYKPVCNFVWKRVSEELARDVCKRVSEGVRMRSGNERVNEWGVGVRMNE